MKKNKTTGVLVVLLAATAAASLAWGKQEHESEAMVLAKTKITLTQAIDNALLAVPGQALSAELDDEKGQPVFIVEVVSQGKTYEVTLDTQNGKVMDKTIDSEDREDHSDKKDDKD